MMAEEFEGPVIVKRPAGQPPTFEVATFDGEVDLKENVFVGGTVAARGNVDTEGGVNTGFVKLFGSESVSGEGGAGAHEVTCVLNCQSADTLSVMHLRAEGNISALSNVNAQNVNAQNVHVTGDVIVSNTDISIRQMAQTLDTIDARTAEMDRKLDDIIERLIALRSMTARMPDGRTLVNVVGTIWDKVKTL